MPRSTDAPLVDAVRHFNRFYTSRIGALDDGFLDSPFPLAAVRVLYELAHRDRPAAATLARALALDSGYLSRILRGLRRRGLVSSRTSADDGRQQLLFLTAKGKSSAATLESRQRRDVTAMLAGVPADARPRLAGAMRTIERLLGDPDAAPADPYLLRAHRPGDMGWVTHRHGVLYAQEYGFDETFEALVAKITGGFIDHFDASCEHCWIAERDGEIVGSVFLVRKSAAVAKLRLLLVEPSARGLGLGRRLVEECVRFARRAGYRRITLWTQSVLHAARHIYERAGFELVNEEPHHSFGKQLVAETWDLDLRKVSAPPA